MGELAAASWLSMALLHLVSFIIHGTNGLSLLETCLCFQHQYLEGGFSGLSLGPASRGGGGRGATAVS